jgi:cell division protein FtsB
MSLAYRPLRILPIEGPPGCRPAAGAMACQRRLTRRPVLLAVCAGFAATGLLVQIIALANNVNALRAEIAELTAQREYLRAETARLTAVWNEVTAPEVVIRRAREELGLVAPDGATPVVVMLDDAERGGSPAWRRWLAEFPPGAAMAVVADAGGGR